MPAHVMEFFIPPDVKLQKSIDAVRFQNKHMNFDGLLKQYRNAEEFKLLKVKMAEQSALAEWNDMYSGKVAEYRKTLRVSYKYEYDGCVFELRN